MLAKVIACCKHRGMTIQSDGGKARAEKLSPDERSRIAKMAAIKRWGDKSPAVVESEERANEVPVNPQIPPPIESQHTKTDQLFEQKKPGYWIFEKEVLRKPCWYCGEEFETRLRLNKFCSPDHKERWLIASLRMGKE